MGSQQVDLSRYRGPLPYIVEWEDVASFAEAPPANATTRGKLFLVSATRPIEQAFLDAGATPGALAIVNTDAYGAPYVFRATRVGDVVCRPDASLLRFEEVRRPDPATSENIVTCEWVVYRSPPQRALDGMTVFDMFDPDGVFDYYARLVGSVLAQLQITNRDMAHWRDPQKIPAEYLDIAAASLGAKFYPDDPERLRRLKVEAAVPASRLRGTDPAYTLKLRHLGYLGYATESWQRQSMNQWSDRVRPRIPVYQQASVVFNSNQNPVAGQYITIQVAQLDGNPGPYMPAPVFLVFDGSVLNESQGNTIIGVNQSGTLAGAPILPGSVHLRIGGGTTTYLCDDDGNGTLIGDVQGVIDYSTGAWSVSFSAGLAAGNPMTADYLKTSVPFPKVLIGNTVRDTLDNLANVCATHPDLVGFVDVGVYRDTTPHLLVQSKFSLAAAGNPVLTVASGAADIVVVMPSTPNGAWNPPSKEIGWPVVHMARLFNDDLLEITVKRSDGSDLFPFLTVGVTPGSVYKRSRGAIVFYNNYLPQVGDRVTVTFGGTPVAFTYGGNWPSVPDNGVAYFDSHSAAETLLSAMASYFGAGMTVSRVPYAFDLSIGVGEVGAGYEDPAAAWIELPHGGFDGEPVTHSATNLVSLHLNAINGAPISFPAVPPPAVTNGSQGPTPSMDTFRERILSELIADVMPVNARIRQWYTDVNLPSLVGDAAESVLVGDEFEAIPWVPVPPPSASDIYITAINNLGAGVPVAGEVWVEISFRLDTPTPGEAVVLDFTTIPEFISLTVLSGLPVVVAGDTFTFNFLTGAETVHILVKFTAP
jgi:hypothetical protein